VKRENLEVGHAKICSLMSLIAKNLIDGNPCSGHWPGEEHVERKTGETGELAGRGLCMERDSETKPVRVNLILRRSQRASERIDLVLQQRTKVWK